VDKRIQELRHNLRLLVRELDLLKLDYTRKGYTTSQLHFLIELKLKGVLKQNQIADSLGLNKSSISRLVTQLQKQGLITVLDDDEDKRVKQIGLTNEGSKIAEKIERRANDQVLNIVNFLDANEMESVLSGLDIYLRAMLQARILANISLQRICKEDENAINLIIRKYNAGQKTFNGLENLCRLDAKKKQSYFTVKEGDKVIGGGGITLVIQNDAEIVYFCLKNKYQNAYIEKFLLDKLQKQAKKSAYSSLRIMKDIVYNQEVFLDNGFAKEKDYFVKKFS